MPPALIAGVVVSLLILSLVVGVLTVLVKVRRKQASETIHSQSEGYKSHETSTVNREMGTVSTQNYEEGQPTQISRHNEDTYDYAAAEGIFTNPACAATVSFIANVSANYSEVVERPL